MNTFICQGCNQEKIQNPRLKGAQKFCGNPACQKVRKRQWQKNKLATDALYRMQQHESLQAWRKNYPLDRYQHQYRLRHPEYVEQNRKRQRIRNRRRRELIVKMDTLNQMESYTYLLTPCEPEKIVKMDALRVKLTVLNEVTAQPAAISP
jgi:hypothetical protein